MQILSVHIREFGGLRDLSLDFSEGLNLIYGGNESGKSTVIAFIRFAFYGLPKRKAGEALSDGDRCYSWENGVADGSLRLAENGTVYRIERREQSGTTRKLLQIVDEHTGEPLPKGETPEKRFLGFPVEVFDSTVCIRQLRSSEIDGGGISLAIENLLLAGDESVNTERVLKNLDKARTVLLYKNGNGGEIHRIDGEISALSARLERLRADTEELKATALQKAELGAKIASAETALRRAEKHCALLSDAEILSRFDALHKEEAQVRRAEEALKALTEAHTRNGFLPNSDYIRTLESHGERIEACERAELRAEAERRIAEEAPAGDPSLLRAAQELRTLGGSAAVAGRLDALSRETAAAAKRTRIFFPVGAVCLFLGILLTALLQNPILLALSLGAFLALPGFAALKCKKRAETERAVLFGKLGIHTGETSPDAFRGFTQRIEAEEAREEARVKRLEAAKAEHASAKAHEEAAKTAAAEHAYRVLRYGTAIDAKLLRETAATLSKEIAERDRTQQTAVLYAENCRRTAGALSQYDESTLRAKLPAGFDPANAPQYTEARDKARLALSALENERLAVERRLSALEATVGSPEALEAELAEKSAERVRLGAKLRAVLLAHESISAARDGLKSRISPRLRADASRYLSVLSCGRYDALTLSREFEISTEENGIAHPSDAYSGGTKDAMYLSLRLALTDLLQNGRAPLPILLDEALAQLDNDRAKALLSLLLTRAEHGGQALFFTCHTREGELLKGERVHLVRL